MFLGRLVVAVFLGLFGGGWMLASGNGVLAAVLTYSGLGSASMLLLSLASAPRWTAAAGDKADEVAAGPGGS